MARVLIGGDFVPAGRVGLCARPSGGPHPQVRVDLYNIDGKIYFGELTMTSQGGYMDYFTDECLLEMGRQVKLTK